MRVLVVDDDERFRDLLQRALATDGHAADLAGNVDEALGLLALVTYDLILLDVMLPGTTGLEMCTRLRESRSDVPILLLTARDAIEDKVAGLDCGADDYLTKPVAFPELFARMRVLLRRHDGRRDPLLRAGELQLNPAHRRLEISGRAVELTGKEFAILELLMRYPSRIFTRDEIAEHVWDFDYEGGSNLIDVYIARLRRKLGPAANCLVTLRGQGYSLQP
jgi:DNA-binding response OmpR family regulator